MRTTHKAHVMMAAWKANDMARAGLGRHNVYAIASALGNAKLASETDQTEVLDELCARAVNPDLVRWLRKRGACFVGLRAVGVKAKDWKDLGLHIAYCPDWQDREDFMTWCEDYLDQDKLSDVCEGYDNERVDRGDWERMYEYE